MRAGWKIHVARAALAACGFVWSGGRASAEDAVIGYLKLPRPKKIVLEHSGKEQVVIVGGKQGEIWPDREVSRIELKKVPIYSGPSRESEKLIDQSVSSAHMELTAETPPGPYESNSTDGWRHHLDGMSRILVYEKRGSWVRVRFQDHPPWNGRFGWAELSEETGGFVGLDN